MAVSVSAEQIERLRRGIADTGSATMFDNAELAALIVEAGGDDAVALVIALRAMIAQAAKLHDYSTDAGDEKKSQIFANLRALLGDAERNVAIKQAAAEQSAAAARKPRSYSVAARPVW